MGRKRRGLDLADLQQQVSMWAQKRWPDRTDYEGNRDLPFYRLVAAAGGMSAIVGEMADGVLFDPDEDERIDPDVCQEELRELLGTIVLMATEFAGRNGWNIDDIVREVWEDMRGDDWERYPKPGRPPKDG